MRYLQPSKLPATPSGRRIYSDDTVEVLVELQGAIAGRLMVVCRQPTVEALDAALEGRLRKVAERAAASLRAAGLKLGPQTAQLHMLEDGRRVLVTGPDRTPSGVHSIDIDIDVDTDASVSAVRTAS